MMAAAHVIVNLLSELAQLWPRPTAWHIRPTSNGSCWRGWQLWVTQPGISAGRGEVR
jgi:hypothetical protein